MKGVDFKFQDCVPCPLEVLRSKAALCSLQSTRSCVRNLSRAGLFGWRFHWLDQIMLR